MVKKFLGLVIGGVMMVASCCAGEDCYLNQSDLAKLVAAGFMKSVESGKPTSSFRIVLHSPQIWPILKKQSQVVNEPSGQQQFFLALSQIFGDNEVKVTDSSIELIIQAAQGGYKGADDIVMAAYGKNFSQVKQSEIDCLKAMISDRMESATDTMEEGQVMEPSSSALVGIAVTLIESVTNLLSGDTKYDWPKIIKSSFGDLISNYEADQLLEFISPLQNGEIQAKSLYSELVAQLSS
jgi:hypothetical protein